jgi:hypothetical protein
VLRWLGGVAERERTSTTAREGTQCFCTGDPPHCQNGMLGEFTVKDVDHGATAHNAADVTCLSTSSTPV